MPATITTTTRARFMFVDRRLLLAAAASLAAAAGAIGIGAGCRGVAGATAGVEDGDVRVLQRRLLQALEFDQRFAVVQDLPQLRVARVVQVALRLHYEIVRRHAD